MERELRKIWTKYVLMYVGVAVLVMLLMIPIYQTAYQQTRNIVVQETHHAVQKSIDRLELELLSVEQYVDSILSSEPAVHMAYLEDNNHYHLRLAMELADEMLTSAAKHVYVDDIVLLFPNGKYVVSRGKVTSNASYYGSVIGYENYDRDTFEDMLYKQRLSFFPVQTVKTNYYNQNVRAVTLNFFGNTRENAYVAACVVLTEERLADTMLNNSIRQNGFLSVKDAWGNILFSYGEERLPEMQGAVINIFGEEDMLQVELCIPESVFEEGASAIKKMIALYILAAMIAAAVVAFVFGTRQYRPVRDYFRYVQSQGIDVQQAQKTTAVANMMTHSLKSLHYQYSSMLENIHQLEKRNRDMLLQNLFNGIDVQQKDIEKHLSGIPALNNSYMLIRVYIEGSSISIADTDRLFHQLDQGILESFPECYFLARDTNVVILSIDREETEQAYEQLERLSERVHHCGSLIATLVASAIHQGIDELSVAYSEMRQLIRHLRVLEGHYSFYCYDRVDDYTSGIKTNLFHPEDLLNLIQPGNEKYLNLWVRGFVNQQIFLSLHDNQRAAAQYYGILNILDDISRKWNISFVPRSLERNNGYDEMMAYFTGSIEKILDAMVQKAEQRVTKHEILKYIDSHYRQSDICLGMLAEEFKLSEAHISRVIKVQTGLTYGAYVETLRMHQAKSLLESSTMPVKDIAYSLGYDNQSTFMKAFKRFYHVPPTSFRQPASAASSQAENTGS